MRMPSLVCCVFNLRAYRTIREGRSVVVLTSNCMNLHTAVRSSRRQEAACSCAAS